MMRQRWTSTIVVTVLLAGVGIELAGTTAQARPHRSPTVIVSRRPGLGRWIGPHHRGPIGPYPGHRRFIPLGPPCPRTVIVPGPITRQIVINPLPRITVTVPTVRVAPTRLTLWVTNSNGSRISVQLTKDGPWYVGPRGECYSSIPTNEQLRVVYGF